MKVSELIEQLQDIPEDFEVFVADDFENKFRANHIAYNLDRESVTIYGE